jgi:hypothetical protein
MLHSRNILFLYRSIEERREGGRKVVERVRKRWGVGVGMKR